MQEKIKELNDLFDYDYKIYQIKDYFKFASDSVLLSEFVKLKKKDKEILDLCTGNAPIPMILTKRYGDKIHITGVELQKEIYNLAIESIEYNKLTNIDIINDDVNNCLKLFRNKHFDVITCNPPYFKYDETRLNEEEIKAIARHEIKLKLEDIIKISSKLLNTGGYLYMSFKYGMFEGYRGERYFTNFTEKSFEEFIEPFSDVTIMEQWISSDVRPGRGEEKWLNMILQKRTIN